jgi:hypothetical protein
MFDDDLPEAGQQIHGGKPLTSTDLIEDVLYVW